MNSKLVRNMIVESLVFAFYEAQNFLNEVDNFPMDMQIYSSVVFLCIQT
jgi:hypothetical protein